MAREAFFTMDLSLYTDSLTKLISAFEQTGWLISDAGAEHLPLHDDDDFDWQQDKLTEEELFSLIEEKQKCGELCGLILYHQETGRGIHLLARTTAEVMVSIDIYRKTICGDFTDISWYIENLAAKLEAIGCTVFSLEYHEVIG